MNHARMVKPEDVWMMTRRASERRMFLKPGPMVRRIFLYLLAWAAGLFDVTVLCAYVGGDHYHVVVYDPRGRVSCFAERLNGMVARVLNWRWGRVGDAFWDNNDLSLVRLVDADTILRKAVYAAANPTQDGLLKDPSKWPGVWLTAKDLGKTLRLERPKIGFFGERSKMPLEVTLTPALPPQLAHLTVEEYRARHDVALAAAVKAARGEMKRQGKRFLGLEGLRATTHETRATRPERRGRGTIRPQVAASSKVARMAALAEIASFRQAYAKARERYIEGESDVTFPAGTYQLRILFGVKVAAT